MISSSACDPPKKNGLASSNEDESFYRYTSGRWLFNEEQQLSKRYVRFNVAALKQVASDELKLPCISITKLPEGLFNKVFLLKMSNGQELIAKIPNPNAGVAHYTVASEVATLDFLRTVLGIPAPKVYAWNSCSSTSNPVGAEYIVMEKVTGNEVDKVWQDMSEVGQFNLVKNIVQIEAKLTRTRFLKFGNLYYAEGGIDQGKSTVSTEKLFLGAEDEVNRKFTIGKSIERAFWADERSTMEIHRGPWVTVEDYFTAIAQCEVAWITSYAKQEAPEDSARIKLHVELLEQFLLVLPSILPAQEDILAPILWHTDLHRGNIFVDSVQPSQISGIIDWQGAWVAPFFRQARFASAFDCDWDYPWGPVMPPPLRSDIELLSEIDRQEAQREHIEVKLKKFYEVASRKFNPLLFRALDSMQIDDKFLIPAIFDLIGRSWIDGPVPLRHLLVQITENWKTLMGNKDIICPISYTSDEITKSGEDMETWANAYNEFHTLRTILVGKDGWVSHEEYEIAKMQLERHKDELVELQAKLKRAGGTDVDNVF